MGDSSSPAIRAQIVARRAFWRELGAGSPRDESLQPPTAAASITATPAQENGRALRSARVTRRHNDLPFCGRRKCRCPMAPGSCERAHNDLLRDGACLYDASTHGDKPERELERLIGGPTVRANAPSERSALAFTLDSEDVGCGPPHTGRPSRTGRPRNSATSSVGRRQLSVPGPGSRSRGYGTARPRTRPRAWFGDGGQDVIGSPVAGRHRVTTPVSHGPQPCKRAARGRRV